MGRIGLVLALLIGWVSLAGAVPVALRPMPQITQLKLSMDGETAVIEMGGTFGADTERILITTASGHSIETTPDHPVVRTKTLSFIDHEHITVVTFDRTGLASEPFESDVMVVRQWEDRERHHHCGMGEALLGLGSVVLAFALLIVLAIVGMIRKRAPFSVAGELLSPIHAENVARAVARGYSIKLMVAVLTITGLATFGHPYLAILTGPFAFVWLLEVIFARVVVAQFDAKIERLEKRENWIYINSSKLYAPRRVWEKSSSLPAASAIE